MADKGLVVHEQLEGGIAPEALIMVVMAGCGSLAGGGLTGPGAAAEGAIVAHRGVFRGNLRGPTPRAIPRPVKVPCAGR